MTTTATPRVRKTPAADQFAALGIDPADWTPAMAVAVKQGWGGLPVAAKVADLRDDLAAVAAVPVDVAAIAAQIEASPAYATDDERSDAVAAEVARLGRNAKVNAWRERKRLQAALDARELRFAKMRAARGAAKAAA